jgi:hypothetical protein
MIELALNPTAPQTEERLFDHIRAERVQNWYALIDTAFDYKKRAFPLPAGSTPVYQGISLEDLQPVSPALVPIPIDRKDTLHCIHELLAHCSGRPMLSFLATSPNITAEQLISHWQPLHRVRTPDGQKLLLRFADTRTLSHLPRTLTPEQWAAWHRDINEWFHINRRGDLERLPPPKSGAKPVNEIRLGEDQFARMLEATDTDAILDFIRDNQPEAIPEHLNGFQFYQYAELSLNTLRRHNIQSSQDAMSIIVGAISTDGKLLREPQLNAFLSAKQWESGKLGATLAGEPWVTALFEQPGMEP